MSKVAFLFPGQGSQAPGMGRELAEHFSAAREVFERADAALNFPLSRLCFEGPEEALRLTENTQPAILTCSVATWVVLAEKGIQPDFVAGHSLGEYSALVAAGALHFEDAVRLVRRRGQYMQEAVPAGTGAMAALLGLPNGTLERICAEAAQGEVVAPANLNSPDQVVIAGHKAAVERAVALAEAAGAKRAVMLAVSAPFHCPLMEPARQRLQPDLAVATFRDLQIPLVNNFAALEIRTAEEARRGLMDQVANPVRWGASIRYLAAQGVSRFVEVGPGRVLTGLLRHIDRSLNGTNVEDLRSLERLLT
ncbi:MAG: ACP S-malonyltransferase [Acidobacteria bacterium]|nr:ACP S-malonyltransferase [Acidobacteriota bacterium]